jgi:excisionase family DNA binding protein
MRVEPSSEFVALGEAARILRCSPELARRLADDGALPAIRLGNRHRIFRREDVERVAHERRERRGQGRDATKRAALAERGFRLLRATIDAAADHSA